MVFSDDTFQKTTAAPFALFYCRTEMSTEVLLFVVHEENLIIIHTVMVPQSFSGIKREILYGATTDTDGI